MIDLSTRTAKQLTFGLHDICFVIGQMSSLVAVLHHTARKEEVSLCREFFESKSDLDSIFVGYFPRHNNFGPLKDICAVKLDGDFGTTGEALKLKELEAFEELPPHVWEWRLVVVQDANAVHVSFAHCLMTGKENTQVPAYSFTDERVATLCSSLVRCVCVC